MNASFLEKIASYSGFAVTAFLRIKDRGISQPIDRFLTVREFFAFNGCERRFRVK